MPRHSTFTIGAGVLGVLFCGLGPRPTSAVAAGDYAFYHENVLGTSLELRVAAESAEAARGAEARALAEIDRLAAIFSGYDPDSEFSRWQATRGRPSKVSPELFEMLEASDRWRARSLGAFDPRVEALTRLWSRCARQDRSPTPGELAEARALMGPPAWRLDPSSRTAERLSDCPISLNAIAKGYIVERACAAALEGAGAGGVGIRGLLLNVGGDLRACGDVPSTIGIAAPRGDSETSAPLATIEVRNRAVATSGNSQRGFEIHGRHHSHIFDPRTGRPVERTIAATVIAERSADADALATIFNVLPIEESLRLAESTPGVACLLVSDDGRVVPSVAWRDYEKARPTPGPVALADVAPEPLASAPQTARNDDFELLVTFEISNPGANARRYRRPYVAVWVEGKDGVPVRTLTLWVQADGRGPRWIPDLKRWYRGDQDRRLVDDTNLVATISRPTRPPGKYEVIWDGKDDQGKPLNPGEYTVSIESAREHGSYQIIRKTVRLADQPFVEELKGNVEIKSASLAYRRRVAAK